MRVIAGDSRGIRLQAMAGLETRPTIERVKEAMFSSVQFITPGACVLDLFAGSGQIGIEALSRGAKQCVFIDQSRDAIDIVQKNLKTARLYEKARVAQGNAEGYLKSCRDKFDIVFIDAPYNKGYVQLLLPLLSGVMNIGGVVLCETEKGAFCPQAEGALTLIKQYSYGAVMVSRYEMQEEA